MTISTIQLSIIVIVFWICLRWQKVRPFTKKWGALVWQLVKEIFDFRRNRPWK